MDNKRKVYDPGWNDPPLLAANSAPSLKPRTILNKRVAYPLTGSPPTNVPAMPIKTVTSCTPPATVIFPSTSNESEEPIANDALLKALKTLGDLMSVMNEDSKKSEIEKRMEVMKNMWLDGKLSPKLQAQVLKIINHLKCKEIDDANKIYLDMTMYSGALGSTWMVGFKYLIYHYKSS